ncbi:unnamed protein product [Angiostrongylus costaricensis]|uniref:Uncharacterized protein n=1 Tax=Angiostrongylus costaricensis TaxID=334426 RepID=A0A0R3P9K5_ANGCS|nr:unnamed protein product [Angiostrongylus costaricensis]
MTHNSRAYPLISGPGVPLTLFTMSNHPISKAAPPLTTISAAAEPSFPGCTFIDYEWEKFLLFLRLHWPFRGTSPQSS